MYIHAKNPHPGRVAYPGRIDGIIGQSLGNRKICKEIKGGYTSELLSDVMGNAREGNIWITLQTHKNIMAIASLKELAAIVLVKGYRPEEDTVSESEAEGIPILRTSRQTFEMTGEIYELLQKKGQ